MIKFKIYLLKRKMIRILHKLWKIQILKDICYLIVDVFKIALLIFILMLFMFAVIMPRNANVSFECVDDNGDFLIFANRYTLNSIGNPVVDLEFNEGILNLSSINGVTVAGKYYKYDDYDSMEIELNNNENSIGKLRMKYTNPNEIRILAENDNGTSTNLEYRDKNLKATFDSDFRIMFYDNIEFNIDSGDAYLVLNNDIKIPIDNITIDGTDSSNIGFYVPNFITLIIDNNFDLENKKYFEFYSNNVANFEGNITGDLTFYYSLNPIHYHFEKQSLNLRSDNKLECMFGTKSGVLDLFINGMVDEASASEVDLFPSFFGWFRSEPYSITAYIITTILGGISLYKRRKQ